VDGIRRGPGRSGPLPAGGARQWGGPLPAGGARQWGGPLLAGAARPWAGVVLACCAALTAVLGALFAHQASASDWADRAVDSHVIGWLDGHQGLAARLAAPGSTIPAIVLSVAIVAGCLLTRRVSGAVLAAVAVPAATGLNDGVLKHLVHRTYLGVLSYPSGHTATMSALAATVTVLLVASPRPGRAKARRALITAAAWLLAGVVAAGVIGLRWHYFTDTVAGAAVGTGTVCALALLLDLPVARRLLGVPPAAKYAPREEFPATGAVLRRGFHDHEDFGTQ
jgi:membrane-associated phospholipid phosphatase